MSGISRVGAPGAVSRDTPSNGHEAVNRARDERDGVAERPRDERAYGAAKEFEKYFLGEMTKAMRSTVSMAEKPSMGESIYRDQLDSQYVDAWGEQGGIGLADLIYNQVMERFYGGQEAKAFALRAQGPIALSDRDISRVSRVRPTEAGPASNQIPLRVEVDSKSGTGAVQVKSPWEGTVVSRSLVGGKTALTLEHMPGLKSTLLFDGVASSGLEPGQKVEKGRTVGLLNPDANSFFLNLGRTPEPDAGPGNATPL